MAPTRPRTRTALLVVLVALLLVAGGIAIGLATGRGGSEAAPATVTTVETTSASGTTGSGSVVDVARDADGVVSIVSTVQQDGGLGSQESVGQGSGFVLDRQGRIVTNDHVVDGATKVHVSFADGTKVEAKVLATDPLLDLAVIQVDVPAATLHPLPLGNAERLRLGEQVVAIGNPFGLDRSVSTGIVSGLGRQITAPNGFTLSNAIQTDAAINHGNSGGPLLDLAGEVVGINAQIADSGVNANVGVGFAVALDDAARNVISTLAQGKTVEHSWLGISLDGIDAILATSGQLKTTSGALVTGIVPGGPAADAGLHGGSSVATIDGAQYCVGGDVITSVDGTTVEEPADLQTAIAAKTPGTTVSLGLVRADGSKRTVKVTLQQQPTSVPTATSGCGS